MKESRFDGGVIDCLAASIVPSALISITFGFGTPWAIAWVLKWFFKHSVISGKHLKFTGTGGGLFVRWIIWGFLTIITFGIYSLWVAPKLYNWIVSNVEIDE